MQGFDNFCFQLSRHLETAKAMPAGWRFAPTDEEIVDTYLKPKVEHTPLPPNPIHQIDLRKWDPKTLTDTYEPQGGGKWYFYTPRFKKDPNGSRPSRSVLNGFWKITGKDTKVKNKNEQDIGKKNTLVYYQGPCNKEGLKTDWIMHEYVLLSNKIPTNCNGNTTRDPKLLDEWVLCEIHMHGAQNRKLSRFETWPVEEEDGKVDKVINNAKEDGKIAMEIINRQEVQLNNMAIFCKTLPSHATTMSFDHCWNDPIGPCNLNPKPTDHIFDSLEPAEVGWHNAAAAKEHDIVDPFAPYDFENQLWLDSSDFDDELSKLLYSPDEADQPSKRQKCWYCKLS